MTNSTHIHAMGTRLARVFILLLVLGTPLAACSIADPAQPPQAARGSLISAEPLVSLEPAQVRSQLEEGGWGSSPVHSGVDAYRLTYQTIDAVGEPVRATGVLALPRSRSSLTAPVIYTHGTTTFREESPSYDWADPYANGPILAIAGAGFAAVAPDYLGLGRGEGTHPWLHSPTQASATLDMLAAARAAASRLDTRLADEVHLIGFSQGASAALATAEAAGEDVDLGSVFAISGAYDFAGTELPALLSGRQVHPKLAVAYVSLLLVSWNRIWPLYEETSEVFRPPYAERVESLFDGTTPGPVMLDSLPDSPDQLLTPRGRDLLEHPTPELRQALAQADDVCRWQDDHAITLLRATDDEQAVAENTTVCAERLRDAGHGVEIVELGGPEADGSRHIWSNVAGTALAIQLLVTGS